MVALVEAFGEHAESGRDRERAPEFLNWEWAVLPILNVDRLRAARATTTTVWRAARSGQAATGEPVNLAENHQFG